MAEKFANLVSATLSASITTTSTTLSLQSGDGANFPVIASGTANVFRIFLTDKSGNTEIIMICRHESGSDTLYIGTGTSHQSAGNVAGRAQESTTALAITYTDAHTIHMDVTAAQMEAAAEYSSLGGLTASVAELNIMDGVTASAAEINTACDGSTAKNSHTHTLSTGATDVTSSATELNILDADNRAIGDIITEISAGTMGAISAGTAGQILVAAGAATLPAWTSKSLNIYIGTLTIGNSGTVSTTSPGFNPNLVIFLSAGSSYANSFSVGFDDGTNKRCIYSRGTSVSIGKNASYSFYYMSSDESVTAYGYISAKAATGFTVTISGDGTLIGHALYYCAIAF